MAHCVRLGCRHVDAWEDRVRSPCLQKSACVLANISIITIIIVQDQVMPPAPVPREISDCGFKPVRVRSPTSSWNSLEQF